MKRSLIVAVLVGLASGFVRAQDAAQAGKAKQFLDQLQVKLDHSARRANQPTATGSSVVGVRGSKQEPLSKQLYWKGKKGPAAVTPDEVKAFRSAIEQAQAGKTSDAVASLKAFQEKYPKSVLVPDAKETIGVLEAMPVEPLPAGTPGVAS